MNPDILKPKEENLFSLAAEMGLVVLDVAVQEPLHEMEQKTVAPNPKPFSQLT